MSFTSDTPRFDCGLILGVPGSGIIKLADTIKGTLLDWVGFRPSHHIYDEWVSDMNSFIYRSTDPGEPKTIFCGFSFSWFGLMLSSPWFIVLIPSRARFEQIYNDTNSYEMQAMRENGITVDEAWEIITKISNFIMDDTSVLVSSGRVGVVIKDFDGDNDKVFDSIKQCEELLTTLRTNNKDIFAIVKSESAPSEDEENEQAGTDEDKQSDDGKDNELNNTDKTGENNDTDTEKSQTESDSAK